MYQQKKLNIINHNPKRVFTAAGINGGYYSGGLQQAHSTTPLEAPHSAGHAPPQSAVTAPPPVSAVSAAPASGIQHAMVSKSVCLLLFFIFF